MGIISSLFGSGSPPPAVGGSLISASAELPAELKPFYKELCEFMCSGPIVVQMLEGENAIELYRDIMGATDPNNAKENTIRKEFARSVQENAVHGSDNEENAKKELEFFFKVKTMP